MEGEQTEYVWGVIDFTPDTDFPDIRNKCVIHSNNGTCMVIPREGDKVRLYIQLDSKNGADTSTMKRVDKSQMSPHQLLDVCTPFLLKLEYHSSILGTGSKEIISAVHLSNTRVF
jgi:phenol 2-monooxygenase (NADPH)